MITMDEEKKEPAAQEPAPETPEDAPAADSAAQDEASPKKKTKKKSEAEKKAEALEGELDLVKDKLLRTLAEYDNFRKRSAKEKSDAYVFSKADVIEKLLPVVDNFGRAAANDKASFEDYKKGVEMIYKQFLEIFRTLGVEEFGEKGETFDPNIHNAVMHIEDEAYGEGEIVDVFAKGYRLGDRVIRSATVRVAN